MNYCQMRITINLLALIVFVVQIISFVFNVLTLKKPKCTADALYNCFIFTAFLCSLLTVVIFVVQYNFNAMLLKKKSVNCLLLIIVMLGTYIHISQLFILNDFIIPSCILLLIDIYVLPKIMKNIVVR